MWRPLLNDHVSQVSGCADTRRIETQFRRDLQKMGYQLTETQRGRNSLFEALAMALDRPLVNYLSVRNDCSEFVLNNYDKGHFYHRQSLKDYIEFFSYPRHIAYAGGELMIMTACHVYKVNMSVLLPNGTINTYNAHPSSTSSLTLTCHFDGQFNVNTSKGEGRKNHSTKPDAVSKECRGGPTDAEFCESLRKSGFKILQIKPNGNCLYTAIANGLGLPDYHQMKIRLQCYRHVQANKDQYRDFIHDEEKFRAEVADIQQNCKWGGEIAIHAASALYNVNIVVHLPNGPPNNYPYNLSHPNTIHVSRHNKNHYNRLIETGRVC